MTSDDLAVGLKPMVNAAPAEEEAGADTSYSPGPGTSAAASRGAPPELRAVISHHTLDTHNQRRVLALTRRLFHPFTDTNRKRVFSLSSSRGQ